MATRARRIGFSIAGGAVVIVAAAMGAVLPSVGAGALLHPLRRVDIGRTPTACEAAWFDGVGVTLAGWNCRTWKPRRGTVIYLHGVADNRGSARRLVDRFVAGGFDVIAYDSRANGRSTGEICTYGFYEKQDLQRVIGSVAAGPVVLFGQSLGAAIALQAAAIDPRVTTVVAAETFSDLRSIATERAPFFFTPGVIRRGLAMAETLGAFVVDDVSPLKAAAALTIPVLLIHGDADVSTPPEHSRRVEGALAGPKRLILVPGAGHSQSLRGEAVWMEIEQWIDQHVPRVAAAPGLVRSRA
jgi:alpha-beta hydrolase superfamily lysophospholipase